MLGQAPSLLAFHAKPLPDELLSCWLVRLAHGHGLKVQTFSELLFEGELWNRDIDRHGPDWLIDTLALRTGTPREVVFNTSLKAYEGILYRTAHESWIQEWILPLVMYHRKRRGHGLQYCSKCLAEDAVPYFRKRWRVAFNTYCPAHNAMLRDRCPVCGAPVAFHRRELGKPDDLEGGTLTQCFQCDFDLRACEAVAPTFYEESARRVLETMILGLDGCGAVYGVQDYNVLGQLCFLVTHRYRTLKLHQFVEQQVNAPVLPVLPRRAVFESLSVVERHHYIQLSTWLMADFEARIGAAWHGRAVTYSALRKDFEEDRPAWFDNVVERFSDWRHELMPARKGRGHRRKKGREELAGGV